MIYIKNILFFILIISGLAFAKQADYAKVISSDIYSTIIEFDMDDEEFQILCDYNDSCGVDYNVILLH